MQFKGTKLQGGRGVPGEAAVTWLNERWLRAVLRLFERRRVRLLPTVRRRSPGLLLRFRFLQFPPGVSFPKLLSFGFFFVSGFLVKRFLSPSSLSLSSFVSVFFFLLLSPVLFFLLIYRKQNGAGMTFVRAFNHATAGRPLGRVWWRWGRGERERGGAFFSKIFRLLFC